MGIAVERISVVLGYLTMAAALAVFASCRTFPALLKRLGFKDPVTSETYQSFYYAHTFFWLIFFVLLVAHLVLVFAHTGIPRAGEPEASLHWAILALGLGAAVSLGFMFASCRLTNNYFLRFLKKGSPAGRGFSTFYAFHSYYWFAVLVLIATHFYFVHSHVGFWPMGNP